MPRFTHRRRRLSRLGCCAATAVPTGAIALSVHPNPAKAPVKAKRSRSRKKAEKRVRMMTSVWLFGQCIVDEIRNDVRVGIQQNQPVSDEAVLEILGELGQRLQYLGRHGGKRDCIGIAGIHSQLE